MKMLNAYQLAKKDKPFSKKYEKIRKISNPYKHVGKEQEFYTGSNTDRNKDTKVAQHASHWSAEIERLTSETHRKRHADCGEDEKE